MTWAWVSGYRRQAMEPQPSVLNLKRSTKVNKNTWRDAVIQADGNGVGEGLRILPRVCGAIKDNEYVRSGQSYQEHVEFRGNAFQLEIIGIDLQT